MLLHGIEVDRVAGRKLECFYTDVHLESSLNQVKQFHSRVKVWLDQVPRQRVKMRQVAVQLSVIYAEIEAFEVPGKVEQISDRMEGSSALCALPLRRHAAFWDR